MTYYIPNPEDRRLIQTNKNDFSGNIFSTKNINLESGYISLSSGVATVTEEDGDDDDLDEFKQITSLKLGDDELIVKGSDYFKVTSSSDVGYEDFIKAFSSTTSTPDPNSRDDLIYFKEQWIASEETSNGAKVYRLDESDDTWKEVSSFSSREDEPIILEPFDVHNGLMIARENLVKLYDSDLSLDETLTIPDNYYVTAIDTIGSLAYIGTHNTNGNGKLFIWDGNETTANNSFSVEQGSIVAVINHDSSIYVIVSDGRILRFNGGGFDFIANWPVYFTQYNWGLAIENIKNSIITDGEHIYTNTTGEIWQRNPEDYLPNQPGGVWKFRAENGLYHNHALSRTLISIEEVDTLSDVSLTNHTITVAEAPPTGTPVRYDERGSGALLSNVNWYYVIKVDGTTIKLATSRKKAFAGENIELKYQGNTSQKLIFYTEKDYGQLRATSQAILLIPPISRVGEYAEKIIFAGNVGPDNNEGRLCVVPPGLYNRGYFTTPKLYSINEEETYQPVAIKHLPLKEDDEIVIKYKTKEYLGLPTKTRLSITIELGATWKSTSTIEIDTDVSASNYLTQDLSMVEIGDEIEIIDGIGSGQLFHIADIAEAGGVYTFTLDEECYFAVVDERIGIIIDRWTKLGTINSENQNEKTNYKINETGKFIQLKVELRGQGTTIQEVQIGNETYLPVL